MRHFVKYEPDPHCKKGDAKIDQGDQRVNRLYRPNTPFGAIYYVAKASEIAIQARKRSASSRLLIRSSMRTPD